MLCFVKHSSEHFIIQHGSVDVVAIFVIRVVVTRVPNEFECWVVNAQAHFQSFREQLALVAVTLAALLLCCNIGERQVFIDFVQAPHHVNRANHVPVLAGTSPRAEDVLAHSPVSSVYRAKPFPVPFSWENQVVTSKR